MQCVFQSWTELLQMDGFGGYVWSAYGCMAIGLFLGVIMPWRQHRRNLQSRNNASKA